MIIEGLAKETVTCRPTRAFAEDVLQAAAKTAQDYSIMSGFCALYTSMLAES